MSFDPYGYPDPPQSPPPGGLGAPPDGPVLPGTADALNRVKLPALFLIAVGVLNLMGSLYFAFEAVYALVTPADKLYAVTRDRMEQISKSFPSVEKELREQMANRTPEGVKNQAVGQASGFFAFTLLVAALVIFGGVRMLQLRSYALCMFASLVAATPCISLSSCCCLGEIVGVWSVVVLLSPSIRMAFR